MPALAAMVLPPRQAQSERAALLGSWIAASFRSWRHRLRADFCRCILVQMLELDCGLEFSPLAADFFAAMPARPGIFLLEMRGERRAAYLARTVDIRRAAERLSARSPKRSSKRLNLARSRGANPLPRHRLEIRAERSPSIIMPAQIFRRRYRDFMRLRPPAC